MKTIFGAVLNFLMYFVEVGKHQHSAMQKLFICDLSKGRNSFGIVQSIWVAECLGGGTGKLAANSRIVVTFDHLSTDNEPRTFIGR